MPVGAATPVEGGFRLSGRWKYASGSDHTAWAFLGATPPGGKPEVAPWVQPVQRRPRIHDRKSFMTRSRTIILAILMLAATAAPASAVELGLPIECDLGRSCHVQNYVDTDPGPDAKDFSCGGATYDGHKGVDIRVLSIEAAARGVEVIAAASGKVRGLRDGVAERLVASEADRAAVASKECGNGVVLTHEGGIETQYCHMKRGSIRVKTGQEVKAGDVLGEVGLSGLTQFPHVHFEIHPGGGGPIPPFAYVSGWPRV